MEDSPDQETQNGRPRAPTAYEGSPNNPYGGNYDGQPSLRQPVMKEPFGARAGWTRTPLVAVGQPSQPPQPPQNGNKMAESPEIEATGDLDVGPGSTAAGKQPQSILKRIASRLSLLSADDDDAEEGKQERLSSAILRHELLRPLDDPHSQAETTAAADAQTDDLDDDSDGSTVKAARSTRSLSTGSKEVVLEGASSVKRIKSTASLHSTASLSSGNKLVVSDGTSSLNGPNSERTSIEPAVVAESSSTPQQRKRAHTVAYAGSTSDAFTVGSDSVTTERTSSPQSTLRGTLLEHNAVAESSSAPQKRSRARTVTFHSITESIPRAESIPESEAIPEAEAIPQAPSSKRARSFRWSVRNRRQTLGGKVEPQEPRESWSRRSSRFFGKRFRPRESVDATPRASSRVGSPLDPNYTQAEIDEVLANLREIDGEHSEQAKKIIRILNKDETQLPTQGKATAKRDGKQLLPPTEQSAPVEEERRDTVGDKKEDVAEKPAQIDQQRLRKHRRSTMMLFGTAASVQLTDDGEDASVNDEEIPKKIKRLSSILNPFKASSSAVQREELNDPPVSPTDTGKIRSSLEIQSDKTLERMRKAKSWAYGDDEELAFADFDYQPGVLPDPEPAKGSLKLLAGRAEGVAGLSSVRAGVLDYVATAVNRAYDGSAGLSSHPPDPPPAEKTANRIHRSKSASLEPKSRWDDDPDIATNKMYLGVVCDVRLNVGFKRPEMPMEVKKRWAQL